MTKKNLTGFREQEECFSREEGEEGRKEGRPGFWKEEGNCRPNTRSTRHVNCLRFDVQCLIKVRFVDLSPVMRNFTLDVPKVICIFLFSASSPRL